MTAVGWAGGADAGEEPAFDLAVRGYDRAQVEDRLAQLQARLAAAEDELRQSRMQTDELGEQLRLAVERLRQSGLGSRQKDSFGFRVEKILRMAEEEARELRERSGAESAAMIEQARTEAATCRAEAERVSAEAHREAERTRAHAQAHAAELTAQVEAELAGRRQAAERELSRIVTAHGQVWAELTRLRELLRCVVPNWPPPAATEPDGAGSAGGAGPAPGQELSASAPSVGTRQPDVPQQTGERSSRHRQAPRHASMAHRVGGGVG